MKTKTIIRLAIWITMATLLEACCMGADDTYHTLSKDAINVWEIGDTLIYTSNWGNADTFFVYSKTFKYDCYDNEEWCDTKTCNQYLNMNIKKIGFEDNRDSSIIIYTNSTKNKKIGGSVEFKDCGGTLREIYYFSDEIEIHNTIYKDVFKFPTNPYLPPILNYIYYNKKFGVIQYQFLNEELWTLQTIKN